MALAKEIQINLAPSVLLQAIGHMDDDSFNEFFQQLMSMRSQRKMSDSHQTNEVELLQKIVGASLLPNEHARLIELGYKLEDESIDPDEQAELAILTERSERLNVERLKAVQNLAELRSKTFQVTMEELGLLNTYA